MRVVYSPLDALTIAKENPGRQVVFFGIGFETTAPANAMTVYQANRLGIENFSLLVSHVLVPAGDGRDHGFARVPRAGISGGRACVQCDGNVGVPGRWPRSTRSRIVVTGFEPLDLLEGIRKTVLQLESGRYEVENAYARAVTAQGNTAAKAMLEDVFAVSDRTWRGIGSIPDSGWQLAPKYAYFGCRKSVFR